VAAVPSGPSLTPPQENGKNKKPSIKGGLEEAEGDRAGHCEGSDIEGIWETTLSGWGVLVCMVQRSDP
jgi:hypothetical protein